MDHILRMQEDQRIKNLHRVLLTNRLAQTAISLAQISYGAAGHILKVYTEHIIVSDLTTVVGDNMLVFQVFKSVDFLL